MMLLIGSHAQNIRLPHHERREPADTDLIGTIDDVNRLVDGINASGIARVVECRPFADGKKYLVRRSDAPDRPIEVEVAWTGTTGAELMMLVGDDPGTLGDRIHWQSVMIPSIDVLLALKLSHRYLKDSPHFLKTMRDIQTLRRHGAGVDGRTYLASWLKERERETYTYSHPKLNVMKADFFTGDGVKYVYDHDTIHVSMAHLRNHLGLVTPAYRFYMKDGAEVMSDREKFFCVDEEVRLLGVLEEVQVLALERSQVPFRDSDDPPSPRWSFDKAHMKVCTSITSGWFREYAWENYDRVQGMYEPDYVERFWRAVDEGVVRKLPTDVPTEEV